MHDLVPLTALGGSAAQIDTIGSVTIAEQPGIALASVAARFGNEKAAAETLSKFVNAQPPEPGKATLSSPISMVWMAQDQWMLFADYQTHETFADELRSALGQDASVTEQSDAWVCFDLRGESVIDMCERLCAAPVRRMQTADAQRTTVHHLGCFIICLEAGQEIRFMGPRSSAGSLHHALISAARSVA